MSALPRAPDRRTGAARPRVLVVDDSPIFREVLKKTLSHPLAGDCDVIVASDGEQALGMLREHQIDLVVSDVQMPNMTGGELVEALRSSSRNAHTPIVIVSALRDQSEQKRMQLMGVSAYLHKPVFPDVLLGAVRSALALRPTQCRGMTDDLVLAVASEVMEDFASLIVDRAPRELEWPGRAIHAEIAFSGSLVGSLGLLAPVELMCEVAGGLLDLPAGDCLGEQQARDTLAELSSVLLGSLLSRALKDEAPRQLGLPVVGIVDPRLLPKSSRSLLLWDPAGRPFRIDVSTLLEDVS